MRKRTTMVIDDDLFAAAQQATGLKTRSAVVEECLKLVVRIGERWEASLNPLWKAVDTEDGIMLVRKDQPRSD